jgi:hypothetical protein
MGRGVRRDLSSHPSITLAQMLNHRSYLGINPVSTCKTALFSLLITIRMTQSTYILDIWAYFRADYTSNLTTFGRYYLTNTK